MANWTHKMNIKDLHDKYRNGENDLTPAELAIQVAKRLKAVIDTNYPPIPQPYIEQARDIIIRFENEVEDIDDYDNILDELYDWGDTLLDPLAPLFSMHTPKLCWIGTF